MKLVVSSKKLETAYRSDKKGNRHIEDLLDEDYIPCLPFRGILYVTEFEIEGMKLVKIGITTRSIEERTLEIIGSVFKKYRYFPRCRPKRFRTMDDVGSKEKILHEKFKGYRCKDLGSFSGYTEFFDVPLEDVVEAYDDLCKKP